MAQIFIGPIYLNLYLKFVTLKLVTATSVKEGYPIGGVRGNTLPVLCQNLHHRAHIDTLLTAEGLETQAKQT